MLQLLVRWCSAGTLSLPLVWVTLKISNFQCNQMLGAGSFVSAEDNATFLELCQFKFGGIAKCPGEIPGET